MEKKHNRASFAQRKLIEEMLNENMVKGEDGLYQYAFDMSDKRIQLIERKAGDYE